MQFEAGEILAPGGIAHRAGDMGEAAAETAHEMLGAVAEAEDEEPHASAVLLEVPVALAAPISAHKRFLGRAKDIPIWPAGGGG